MWWLAASPMPNRRIEIAKPRRRGFQPKEPADPFPPNHPGTRWPYAPPRPQSFGFALAVLHWFFRPFGNADRARTTCGTLRRFVPKGNAYCKQHSQRYQRSKARQFLPHRGVREAWSALYRQAHFFEKVGVSRVVVE